MIILLVLTIFAVLINYFCVFMFAIVQTGGKQYKVKQDDVINIELITFENNLANVDAIAIFDNSGNMIGNGGKVSVSKVADIKDNKKFTFKKERRTTHKKKTGHRQKHVSVKILSIKTA